MLEGYFPVRNCLAKSWPAFTGALRGDMAPEPRSLVVFACTQAQQIATNGCRTASIPAQQLRQALAPR
jgi:hypothetical protein